MNQRKKPNKKREQNLAPLFKTCVSVNNHGQLITDHEWVDPKKLVEALDTVAYTHVLASVVRHCMSDSINFDKKLDSLLKTF